MAKKTKTKSIKNKSVSNVDPHKPVTAVTLFQVLREILQDPTLGITALQQPVLMYSDEECNDIGKLWEIKVNKKGQLILRPADAHPNEDLED
jgi:hypothetical protein